MKKIISAILALVLLYGLCGCSMPSHNNNDSTSPKPESTYPSTDPSTTPSSSPSDIDTPSTQLAPMVSVSLPVTTLPGKADDGTVIFNYTYQEISLTLNDPDVAENIILDFMNRVDGTRVEADKIYENAKNEYSNSGDWNPYLCLITYDPMRLDQSIFSLLGCYATYQGSIHPETQHLSVNYDLITGNTLSLHEILTNEATCDMLYKLTVEALSAKSEDYYLFNDYEDLLKPYFESNINRIDDWYLSSNGLCFFFQPYEIAPYASGVIVAEIPYEKLWGILKEDCFPAETDATSGQAHSALFSEINPDKFNKYVELILDNQADNALLYTDGSIQNIRIETGDWSANGTYYTPKHTVFAASGLSYGEAILIEASLAGKLPTLHLHYETNGKYESRFITKDETGKIVLIP